MPSPKILEAKKQIVEDLANELRDAKSIVLSNYQGLTVAQDTEMRTAFRKEALNYRVVKNTISIRALEALGLTGFEEELTGPTALAWSKEDVVLAPRLVKKYADQFKKTSIKAGVVDGKKADMNTMNALASIPSMEVLYGQLVSSLIFPVTSLAMTLNAMAKKMEENGAATVADLVSGAAPAKVEEAAPAEAVETAAPAEKAAEPAEEVPAAAEKAEAPAEEAKPEA